MLTYKFSVVIEKILTAIMPFVLNSRVAIHKEILMRRYRRISRTQ